MLRPATPVTVFDCLDVLAPDGPCVEFLWRAVRHQLTRGPCYALRDETGRALALGGYWPMPTYLEAWAQLGPGASARAGELTRAARLTLTALCQHDPRPVIVIARTAAGARIARLIGMRSEDGVFFFRERAHERDCRCVVGRQKRRQRSLDPQAA